MVIAYRIKVNQDDGTERNFGNFNTHELKVKTIKHIKKDRTAIMQVVLDNVNNEFNNEFTDDNLIEGYWQEVNSLVTGLMVPFTVPSSLTSVSTFKRFSGEVSEVVPNEDNTEVTLICKGNNDILTQRTWSGIERNVDLGQHIKNVLDEEAPEIDTSTINTSTGIILDEVRGNAIYLKDHFDDLFRENTWQLDITVDLVADFFENNRGSSGLILSDQGTGLQVIKGSNKLRESNLTKKNVVTVIGGNERTENFDEDQITWNTGDPVLITLTNPLEELVFVQFNGITMTEGTDFEVTSDRRFIKLLTITDGDTVDIRYDFLTGIWWREQDPGATKRKELVINDPTIVSSTRAEELARATLAKIGIRVTKGSLASDDIKTNFLWQQTLELDMKAFTGEHKIIGFTEDITQDYIVTFEIAEVLDDNARKILDLIRSLEKMRVSEFQDVIIRDGFTLFDTYLLPDDITGFETGIGTRFFWDVSNWDDGKTWDTGEDTETQFL